MPYTGNRDDSEQYKFRKVGESETAVAVVPHDLEGNPLITDENGNILVSSSELACLMAKVVEQLQVMNTYLSMMVGETLTVDDVE